MDSVKDILHALPPHKRSFWLGTVGAQIAAFPRTERSMIRLARKCIQHAYAVNQEYFAARVSAEAIARLEQILAAIEGVSNVEDFPFGETEEMTCFIMPAPDSPDEIVPGWVALLDAVGPFTRYWNERDLASLFWASASAYQSVSNRAYVEFRGVEGNCEFMDDEKELEQNNGLCAREIAYHIEQLAMES